MKKKINMLVVLMLAGLMAGCGSFEEETISQEEYTQSEEPVELVIDAGKKIEIGDLEIIDFSYDYTEDIGADVNIVVSNSSSLQEELTAIDKITEKYTKLSEAALTQGEMNVASEWFYTIWDTELNSLWSRFSDSADQDTKERVLEELRKAQVNAMIELLKI